MSYNQQDELAHLFARNMNFSQPLTRHPATPDKQFIMGQFVPQPQIVYSSQHYTGTSYLYSTSPAAELRADSPFNYETDHIQDTIRCHNVDPASLSPSQLKLFADAEYEQRLRLLELWQISPPENGSQSSTDSSAGKSWSLTSLAQEEELARLRYERRMSELNQTDAHVNTESHEAEPYVLAGYANTHRTDPVYAAAAAAAAAAPNSWQAPSYDQDVHSSGHRYVSNSQCQPSQHIEQHNMTNHLQYEDVVM